MRPTGYSPYNHRESKRKSKIKLPKMSNGFKKWLLIILGVLFGFLFICYLSLGELKFFVNNYLRLGFFHKNYLILLQNNYESRPTGGFITGYGEVSTTMGFVSDIAFYNSYEIDADEDNYITAPKPQEDLLKNEWYQGYTFRDANWEPHFPKSAETLIDFYQTKFPEKEVDGIIVVNFSMIEGLIGELGEIEVDGETLTEENLFKFLTDNVNDVDRHNEEILLNRKNILGQLTGPLLSKAKWHPFKAKSVIQESLANKDLYMWFKSKKLQKKIEKRGWGNVLEMPENSDFLAVNLANLGGKKSDRYLIKEVYHHVDLKSALPEVTTEVVLRYPGSKNIYSDDYKGYLRLYIPSGAQVKSEPLETNTETDEGFKVLGSQVILPAGSNTTFTYSYQLPRTLLEEDKYNLRLIKQSGDNKRYTITAEVPEDRTIESNDFKALENKARWSGSLLSDLDLSLEVKPDVSSPYPTEQVFENLNTIAIYWNEPIETSSGGDALNYEIIDDDEIDTETTDDVKVVYAEVVDDNVVKLELEGVTEQKLERYKITLKNIRDISGNEIEPNPKVITAVQRIKNEE